MFVCMNVCPQGTYVCTYVRTYVCMLSSIVVTNDDFLPIMIIVKIGIKVILPEGSLIVYIRKYVHAYTVRMRDQLYTMSLRFVQYTDELDRST